MIFEKENLQISRQNFLSNLRNETGQLHTQLENLPASQKLTSANLSMNDYIHYLQLMQPVIQFIEKHIFPLVKDVINDVDERRKQHLIQADLQYLHANSLTKQFKIESPETHNIDVALGIMYVIEGSTLGGRIILKNVQNVLGLNEINGALYFAGYREKTSSLWKHFLDKLALVQHQNNAEQKIIAGANAAFISIYNFMQ